MAPLHSALLAAALPVAAWLGSAWACRALRLCRTHLRRALPAGASSQEAGENAPPGLLFGSGWWIENAVASDDPCLGGRPAPQCICILNKVRRCAAMRVRAAVRAAAVCAGARACA